MGLGAHPGSEMVAGGLASATLDVTGVQFEWSALAYTLIQTWPCVAGAIGRFWAWLEWMK